MISAFFIRLIFLVLILTSINFAQDEINYFSNENRLRFGDYLFCDNDYLRAIDEYKLVLKEKNSDSLKLKIALAYQKLGKYYESENSLKELFNSQQLHNDAKFEYAKTLYLSKRFSLLNELVSDNSFIETSKRNEIQKLHHLTQLYSLQAIEDSSKFFQPFNQNESVELLKFYIRKQNLENKSPALAAILSAVIPGLGKIYTGNYGDGITAFLLTGVLTFLSIDNFHAQHDFRGWLFAGLAAYFYAGNIYGSAASAQLFNANLRITFDNELQLFLNKNNHFITRNNLFCK